MITKTEVTLTKDELSLLTKEAADWARELRLPRISRNDYVLSRTRQHLDDVDLSKTPEERIAERKALELTLSEWKECREQGKPLPRVKGFGTLRRTPRLEEQYEAVDFRFPAADYLRLRNYANSQGYSVSAMTRIILGLLDEEDLD